MYSNIQTDIKTLAGKINSATTGIKELIPSLIEDLKGLLNCDAVTLFALDRKNRRLYSCTPISADIPQLPIDISAKTAVGYAATMGKSLNISDAYSRQELSTYHADLGVGSSRDTATGYKTKSLIVVPLPHNKKLVGVIEFINRLEDGPFKIEDLKIAREISPLLGLLLVKLEEEMAGNKQVPEGVDLEFKIHSIVHAIHAAKNIDEILLELKDNIMSLFNASMITIYAVETMKNEIFSKVKSGKITTEIRVPISSKSIAGCVAMEQRMVNIADVYDPTELKKYHPDLTFDSSWDQKTGIRTKSMLVCPMIHSNRLMGVLQLINKTSGDKFTPEDEKHAMTISESISLALYNQGKYVHPKPTKFSYLINNGLITEDELTVGIAKARKNQLDIERILLSDLGLKREDIGKSLETFYGIPYAGYHSSIVLPQQIFSGLNRNYLLKNYWIPLQLDDAKATILINEPNNIDTVQNIKLIFPKRQIEFKVGLKIDIIDFLNSTITEDEEPMGDAKTEQMSALLTALKSEKEEGGVVESTEDEEMSAISETDSAIVRLVNKILTDAYDEGVSDIHIEPGIGKDSITVRFRRDGDCRIYQEIPYLYKQAVLSRIKIMSKLDIAEKRLPQDGKIKMKYGKKEIEYRVATCPTVGGNEDAVLRILAASKPLPLDNMNFSPRNLALTKVMVDKPYGLVLVVGPTGSGKTTTLHSCLGFINTPEIKIWTAEDPVEITQKGLRQVQMQNKIGLDFARAMRSFLRGDPDVIMVGEMRDAETCAIGLEASLTGHLVFSTLHTNSAPETITRLLDMGMNPLNFADALLLILAQRLVRTLCKKCKADYHPTREEFDLLVKEYGEEQFPSLGIQYTDDLMLKKAVGCEKCSSTGYAGRTGLHELLEGTEIMKRMIMKKSLVEELRAQAISDGMTTLKQDGIWKILKGDTDLKQVLAVCIV